MSEWKTVLVGVDGSPSSRAALRWAAAEAQQHGCELVALNAWAPVMVPITGGTVTAPREVPDTAGDAKTLLLQTITDELGENPPVTVQPRVKSGNAAKLLIELSAEADLLVVGTRGHGGFVGLLLGSVSQQVVSHAQCTVAVVR
jgi:nucleotide-binding universal stress UspA family protein